MTAEPVTAGIADGAVSEPSVTAVVLGYGAEPWLARAVAALTASVGVTVDVVVVDNGCDPAALAAAAQPERVRVLRPGGNLGFAGGANLGAAAATGEFLAFVNSDAEVDAAALARLVAAAGEDGVGLVMASVRLAQRPEIINTAGNPWHVAGLSWAGGHGSPARRYPGRRRVPVASGSCFVISRSRWEDLGGFAAEYFAYHEDTELSLRAWQRGLTVECLPDAVVRHHYEYTRHEVKAYLLERNRLVLVLTAYQARTLLLLAPVLVATEAAVLVAALAGGWIRPKLRGWRWLWRNRGWVLARRRRLQRERRVPDAALAYLITARFEPTNVPAPPGLAVYNALVGSYWRVARRLLPRR